MIGRKKDDKGQTEERGETEKGRQGFNFGLENQSCWGDKEREPQGEAIGGLMQERAGW